MAQIAPALGHQVWSTEEGLPDASVHAILQTQDGYLWVGTENGAARFDGSEFITFRHETQPAFSSNDISSMAQTTSGDLWFGTADGLVRSRGETLQHFSVQQGLPSSRVLALAAAAGDQLLVLTDKGLVLWAQGTFRTLSTGNNRPTALLPENNAAICVLTEGDPLFYTNGSLQKMKQRASEMRQAGREGLLWSYTAHTFDLTGPGLNRTVSAGRDLLASRILTAHVDVAGRAWIGTNHGLWFFPPGPATHPQPVVSLNSEIILTLQEDREGNLWVGTETSGLHILRPRKFRPDPVSAGEMVTAVVGTSAEDAWFGTRDGGVYRLQGGKATAPAVSTSLTSPVVLSLATGHHGEVWAGTPDGLNRIEGTNVRQFTSADGLPDDFVRSVLVDRHEVVWAGTRGGLARLEAGRITTRTTVDGLASDSIGPMLEPARPAATDDDLWVGTSRGVAHIRGHRIESFEPEPGSARSTIITAIVQVNAQQLLVAVHATGLMFFEAGQFRAVKLPLAADVSSLVVDRMGFVWMRGARVLARASLAELEHCAQTPAKCEAVLDSFSTADGLPNDAAAEGSPALSPTPDGALWVATRKGLAVADLAHLPVNQTPPPVVLQRFLVDGSAVPVSSAPFVVGPGHSRYVFNFAALSYTLPAKVRYRYRLEGFDRDWVEAGPTRTAYYTSLPARRYRFVVEAQNNDGVWDRHDAVLAFRVLPPFYRRWWFALLLLLFAAGLTWLLVRLRERVVQRRFSVVLQERNRLAREIHDTLAQDFVSISLQLDIASNLLKARQLEAAGEQLQDIRNLIKAGLQAARQSIWNLRASAGEDSLPTQLSTLVSRYSFGGGPAKLTIGGAFRKLPANLESEVLRITQEALSNTSRHAEANVVEIALFYHPDQLELAVRDDGRGFSLQDALAKQGHYGLRGLQERAASLQGKLMIASSPGDGTTLSLSVPLKKELHSA